MAQKTLILPALLATAVICLPGYSKMAKTMSDKAFLAMAAQADMTMAHIGKDAETEATASNVKDFGKTLVDDHTSDYQQLTELAGKTGEPIPKAIDRLNGQRIVALERYRGKSFDHEFLIRQSAEHEKLIHAFKEEATYGSNPAIKAYASKALPTIERHLHEAEDLLKGRA
jgi:putative membrane protein